MGVGWVCFGMTPMQVLQVATIEGARLFKQAGVHFISNLL